MTTETRAKGSAGTGLVALGGGASLGPAAPAFHWSASYAWQIIGRRARRIGARGLTDYAALRCNHHFGRWGVARRANRVRSGAWRCQHGTVQGRWGFLSFFPRRPPIAELPVCDPEGGAVAAADTSHSMDVSFPTNSAAGVSASAATFSGWASTSFASGPGSVGTARNGGGGAGVSNLAASNTTAAIEVGGRAR